MNARLTRQAALSACPVKTPPVRAETRNEKLYVTIEYQRPRWQRWLGADERCRREYGLDAYGREVYDACDGRASVHDIIRVFGKRHGISPAESEKAVTMFVKTLMSRGLIGIAISE